MTYHADRDSSRVMINRHELVETDDSGDMQLTRVMGLAGEKFSKVHRVMPHGLASHAPKGSHGMMIGVSGRRDMAAVFGTEHPKYRPRDLPEGATRLYDTADGFVYLDAAGNLFAEVTKAANVKCKTALVDASESATVKAPEITLEGNVHIKGDLIVDRTVTNHGDMRTFGVHLDNLGYHGG